MSSATKTKRPAPAKAEPQARPARAAAEKAAAPEKVESGAAGAGKPGFAFASPAPFGIEEFARFNRDTLEAFVQAGSVVVSGYQEIGRAWLALGREAVEEAAKAGKAMTAARTVEEMVEVQATLAQASLERG